MRERSAIGLRVTYVPEHAGGDWKHPDVGHGVVSSVSVDRSIIFVRFWPQVDWFGFRGATGQGCSVEDIRLGWGDWQPENPVPPDVPPDPILYQGG